MGAGLFPCYVKITFFSLMSAVFPLNGQFGFNICKRYPYMENKLTIVGGVGIINTWNDHGKFVVRYSGGKKVFSDYYQAAKFYNDLNEAASFWDKTKESILLEKKDWQRIAS
jgi:hypothetical protein